MKVFVYLCVMVITSLMDNVHCVQDPLTPTGVTATKNGSQSIIIEWQGVPNTSVYQVDYRNKLINEVKWNTLFVSGNESSVLIKGLNPYTIYLVRIKANDTNGRTSNFSLEVQVRTDEAPPSELPKITAIGALDCCSISLKWTPISAAKANGVLLGYYVYYLKKADISDYFKKYKKVSINITFTKANLTGLQPYTEYIIGVAAYNSKGVDSTLASIKHVERVRTLEGAPSPPSGLIAKLISSEFVIQWKSVPVDKANGVLLGYRYVVYNSQSQEVIKNNTVSNSTNSTRITNMEICADYTIHLRAWTAAGAGMNAVFNFTNICASPKIIYHKAVVIVPPFLPAVLHCNYTGYPTPSVTWIVNNGKSITPGYALKYRLDIAPYGYKYITPYKNGSLINDFVEFDDNGTYTCIVNNSLGSAEANTTMIVSKDAINITFVVNLTNESFHDDLYNQHSLRFKQLSGTIKTEVLLLYNNTKRAKLQDVGRFSFWKGSVEASFIVLATVRSGANREDAKKEMLDIMISRTKDGKLGQIPVGEIIVLGSPPPPSARISSIQPTYVVLEWTRPTFYKQYQIESYSIRYRKHAESENRYKTVETVQDKDGGTMKGVVTGLDPGQFYYVEVRSHRTSRYVMKDAVKYTSLEVTTPDIMMKQVMLTIVLPLGLAIFITVVMLCIRSYFRGSEESGDIPLPDLTPGTDRYGPREENPYDIGRLLEEFPCRWKEISREDLTLGKELGAGAFGSVVKAELKRDGKSMPCAVKMLKRFATEREHRDLFNELSIMTQVGNHANIVSLIGACTVNGPLWVIVKIAEGGCLLDYLHKHRKPDYTDHAYMNVKPSTSTDVETLDKLQKLKFAHGVARGMKHLEKMKCVHRDLAARNVLLGKSLIPMVSDFGLSRDIYESGMYEDIRGGKRPVRWMAPESIEDYTCTNKSDVWSYGVTIWEIETAGTVPYAGVDSGMDILNEIKKGYRLEQPEDCDDDVYQLMLDTWRANPLDRPTFNEIAERVETMLAGISEYLEIQHDEEEEDSSPYDEVHISDADLTNGYVAQDDDTGDHDDDDDVSNPHVRYTDIHRAAPSEEIQDSCDHASRDQEDSTLQTKC